jgi:phytoene dehydrogenase-like protein
MTRGRALVVGSGPNGLAAAIRLAEAGRRVLVLEAAPAAGGGLATAELTLPGFRHDVASAVHPLAVASPAFDRLPLPRYGLRWAHPPLPLVHPLPDGRSVALHRDLTATAEALDAAHAGDGARWRALAGPLLAAGPALSRTVLAPFPPLRGGLALVRRLGPAASMDLVRVALMAAADLAAERLRDEGAQAWFVATAMHGDVPPDAAGSAIAGLWLGVLGHLVGWPSPRGGAARLAEALVAHLESLGGRVRTGAPVERALVRRGRVAGARLAGGERVSGDVMVCDLTPAGLLRVAGHALPEAYAERLAAFRHGPGTLKVDWALAEAIPWTAPEARRAGTVHVGGDLADLLAAADALRAGRVPERPFVILGQQSLADPLRAPEGRHTGWAYTRIPAGLDPAGEGAALAALEAQVERFAPGFGERVLARHVMASADLEARDANLVGGDVGGGSQALDQLLFRPIAAASPYRTPLPGLYLGSASTWPGGGVHGVGGDAAARAVLRDARPGLGRARRRMTTS